MVRTSLRPVVIRCVLFAVTLIPVFASGCYSDGPPRHWPTLSGCEDGSGYCGSSMYSGGGMSGGISGGAPELLFLVAAIGIGAAIGLTLEGLRRLFSYSPT